MGMGAKGATASSPTRMQTNLVLGLSVRKRGVVSVTNTQTTLRMNTASAGTVGKKDTEIISVQRRPTLRRVARLQFSLGTNLTRKLRSAVDNGFHFNNVTYKSG